MLMSGRTIAEPSKSSPSDLYVLGAEIGRAAAALGGADEVPKISSKRVRAEDGASEEAVARDWVASEEEVREGRVSLSPMRRTSQEGVTTRRAMGASSTEGAKEVEGSVEGAMG
jgi:hypothetical protein